jgi:hypothetical protein
LFTLLTHKIAKEVTTVSRNGIPVLKTNNNNNKEKPVLSGQLYELLIRGFFINSPIVYINYDLGQGTRSK